MDLSRPTSRVRYARMDLSRPWSWVRYACMDLSIMGEVPLFILFVLPPPTSPYL